MPQKYGRNFIVTCFVAKLFRGEANGWMVILLNCWGLMELREFRVCSTMDGSMVTLLNGYWFI